MDLESSLDHLVTRYDSRRDTGPVRWHLDRPGWRWSRGGDVQYSAASVTKLVTNALVLQLADADELSLDSPAAGYLEPGVMRGLHVLDGVDRSEQITVRQLLAHTSGLRDYARDKGPGGTTFMSRALQQDVAFDLVDALAIARTLTPAFRPGAPGKARYSGTNYQLLGAIVERVTGRPYAQVARTGVIDPLGLAQTYIWSADTLGLEETIDPVRYGRDRFRMPLGLASSQPEAGLVTTAHEAALFLRAFLAGELFRPAHLEEMRSTWRRLGFSLSCGDGLMRFLPVRVLTGFRGLPMLGHSGMTGAMCFHVDALDLVVSGTVNQAAKPFLPFNLTVRSVREVARTA